MYLFGLISVDELVGSLIAHEQVLAQLDVDENKAKKEKSIALRATASNSSDDLATCMRALFFLLAIPFFWGVLGAKKIVFNP